MMDGPREDLLGFNKMSEALVSTLIQNSLLSLVFLLLLVFIEWPKHFYVEHLLA